MTEEKYILNCPDCGQVEGFVGDLNPDEEDDLPQAEMTIEQRTVLTPTGPETRLRCPACGRWLQGDRARPA
jgi:predicted RNA-binding Zn-ribbon protein involved in translation (DUF1610 family)